MADSSKPKARNQRQTPADRTARTRPAWVAAIVLLSMMFAVAASWAVNPPIPDNPTWKKVRAAMDKGLPKTAIEELGPLIDQAIQDKNYDQAVRGIATKVLLQSNIQGNQPSAKVIALESEIAKAPDETKPVLRALLAHWYWHYFQQNRWRFAQRTTVDLSSAAADNAAAENDQNDQDFTTWDLKRILSEIDQQFAAALSSADSLKAIASSDYDEFLEKGTASDAYRPTLYDVIADTAIDFYSAGEQAGSTSQDAFVLTADSPIFGSMEDFLAWQPDAGDQDSVTRKAIVLYQQLLRFHDSDADAAARLDWDLARLRFGFNQAADQNKESRYQAALQRFIDQHADHPISARASHYLAQQHLTDDDPLAAFQLASKALSKFPESVGGRRCHNLIETIQSVSINIHAERIWADPMPSIDVSYKNMDEIHFRLLPLDYTQFLKSKKSQPSYLDRNEIKRLLDREPVRRWSVDLKPTDDYRQRTQATDIPDDIPLGAYLLIASDREDFGDASKNISVTEVWRSDLALVTRRQSDATQIGGLVLDSNSGNPIEGAKVQIWQRSQRGFFRLAETVKTGSEGRFQVAKHSSRQVRFLVTHQDDSIGTANPLYQAEPQPIRPSDHSQTIFFTDRSIYRPGQTIQFKGICYWADGQTNDYRTLPDKAVTVVFTDANGQEIEKRTLRTNDYGSFAASVTAPRDRLMGRMILRVESGPPGSTAINVEEYKRPKFRVDIQSPSEPAKLGEEVTVTGKATAYTGVPINDAKVAYRVVRNVRYAPWWYWRCWWMPIAPSAPQEIASGVTETDSQGQFKVVFVAQPDPSVSKESEPTFTYRIVADVTDTTGETRSDEDRLQLRYSAIAAELTSDEFLTTDDPVKLQVQVSGLFGDTSKAMGIVKLHRLIQPDQVARPDMPGHRWQPMNRNSVDGDSEPDAIDPANPNSWELGEVVSELPFETTPAGIATLSAELDAGIYRCVLNANDGNGNEAKAFLQLQVLDPNAKQFGIKIPYVLAFPAGSVEPGQTFQAIWGSGYPDARVLVEVMHRDEVLQRYWTDKQVTQGKIEVAIDETMRGGISLRTTMVRENRVYQRNHMIEVPWTNKKLDIRWERFVSKLEPAAKETWTAIIRSNADDPQAAIAEMVATLYDASLDAFAPHAFGNLSNLFRRNRSDAYLTFENQLQTLQTIRSNQDRNYRDETLTYWRFPSELTQQVWGYGMVRSRTGRTFGYSVAPQSAPMLSKAVAGEAMEINAMAMSDAVPSDKDFSGDAGGGGIGGGNDDTSKPNLDNVSARKNLNETAFFFPQLTSSEDGVVRISFTMPEALTEWKFLGLAHDNQLRSGSIIGTTVTAKDLMVQPNAPRFVREGDEVEFTVKVSNQSATIQNGTVRLSFADARTLESVDAQIGNTQKDQSFSIAAGQSQSLSWRINVSDGLGFLTYKAVGSTGKLSDGEEGFLPVLSRRVLVTESLPLPIRGKQTKQFQFQKLIDSADSDSIDHQSLTVQMVSNPSWYAVMALPYLMEYPHQCSEQTFNRLYANSLAKHIADSDPKIARVFDQWRATPALDSPLEKNEDLKSVLIEESPWQRQAKSESQARRDVGILFDDNRLNAEMQRAREKLGQMQSADGSWPWFDGGPSNSYLTLYITTGFGRLRHLGVTVDADPAMKALGFLDAWSDKIYREIKADKRTQNQLNSTIALYLYGRSFFLDDQPVADEHQEAFQFWISQADQHWLDLGVRQSQAQLAIALKRLGKEATAKAIMASIKERSVSDPELGMFWREQEASWWWYRAPIETQAMMIEAFDEVVNDQASVEDCKVWMLKQKQTQAWQTTKSTADAVYALLLRGSDLLASDTLVDVSLAGVKVKPESVEAGTGFYQQRVAGEAVTPSMGQITVTKVDPGVAWGSVHWQYLEDLSKVTPHSDTPLTLTKQLYVKKNTQQGPQLTRVDGPVAVGDELVVRLVIRTDRDMEFVHLKDHRGSGTEPVNVLSRYQRQDGLQYYESTRDTASHFFIDYLPKGTYVFEYSTRVQLRGEYQTGFANIQCMYAPEFDAHSESLSITCR